MITRAYLGKCMQNAAEKIAAPAQCLQRARGIPGWEGYKLVSSHGVVIIIVIVTYYCF